MSGLPDRITPITQAQFEQIQGASLICCMIMIFLYGIATLQTYLYFLTYEMDSPWLKLTVFIIWSLATIHTFFISHTIWHYDILSYTRPELILEGEWSVYAGTAVGVLACFIVQVFFARTIYHLTRGKTRWALTAAFAVLISAELGFGLFLVAKMFILWDLPKLALIVYNAMVPLFVSRVLADATTAIALCLLLRHTRGSFGRSIKLANTLIIYAVNRFVLTALVVIMQTIILVARPTSIWAMVIEFVSVGLYVNSFLGSLNSRSRLRELDSGTNEYTTTSSRLARIPASGVKSQDGVTITTTQTRYVDSITPINLDVKKDNFSSAEDDFEMADYGSEGKGRNLNSGVNSV